MALTKERKVFFGILIVAGVSLAFDRGILGSPKGAGAAIVDQMTASLTPQIDLGGIQAGENPELTEIASLVQERLFSGELEPDASGVSGMFFPVAAAQEAPRQVSTAASVSDRLPRITAIMPGPEGRGTAVLDGRAVRVGQTTPSGFTLVRVVDRSAVLERNDREYVVELPVFGRTGGS